MFEDVAWSYEEPLAESAAIRGHLSFDPARADVAAGARMRFSLLRDTSP